MNTVNASTSFSLFQLHMGWSLQIIPPLISHNIDDIEDIQALDVIEHLEADVKKVKANLAATKLSQSVQANNDHTDNFPINKGNCVLLSMLNRCNEYKKKGEKHAAKFMPCYDGPYSIINVNPT